MERPRTGGPGAEERDPALADFPERSPGTRRWLFADQLGPHFLDSPDQPVLLVESKAVFARRRFHRQKAHLVLSALRHRAAELGEQAHLHRVTTYAEALDRYDEPLSVCAPTTWSSRDYVLRRRDLQVLAARGFVSSQGDFARWAEGRGGRRLLMEDFYRDARRRLGVLMDGAEPLGGRWNYDQENREPAPRDGRSPAPEPWWPAEDEIDEQVRADLDRWEADGEVSFVGDDGPRLFPVTREEALTRLHDFLTQRLGAFGPHEDAMLAGERWLAHSLLSPAMNLGLLDPLEVVHAAEDVARARAADGDPLPLNSVEGFVRQVMGWRDYIWHTYWHFGRHYRHANVLRATEPVPAWMADLDDTAVDAACLSGVLGDLRRDGWVHHIPRLMVLGNYALQRGIDPLAMTDWFHRTFVDGYDWVMVANVVGMSQHGDGGALATKPYAAGGAYIDRMSDYCRGCPYDPRQRLGEDACPYTAGYWAFLERNRERLAGNQRMRRPLQGLDRLKDLPLVVEQEAARGTSPP
ncbi:deoxyribodipyrimidine photolyase-related protein [Geodermatophilus tzadiensis]|uniref:Deoxyribodipyrimidine photolyase-related protein n=1 Tax=Geodermatophilus tzadiensis TaxID=1137988 RepID=A0A2T0TC27_9ACTN|nr:cryptochrome/photolyase family protein [Geodermatophilus tzadiensis]PRY43216.1 deoxyribodipyrimidine photolyase-related protein [Geodermatophilus tzadiensis]